VPDPQVRIRIGHEVDQAVLDVGRRELEHPAQHRDVRVAQRQRRARGGVTHRVDEREVRRQHLVRGRRGERLLVRPGSQATLVEVDHQARAFGREHTGVDPVQLEGAPDGLVVERVGSPLERQEVARGEPTPGPLRQGRQALVVMSSGLGEQLRQPPGRDDRNRSAFHDVSMRAPRTVADLSERPNSARSRRVLPGASSRQWQRNHTPSHRSANEDGQAVVADLDRRRRRRIGW
jgi:hypothetical protein